MNTLASVSFLLLFASVLHGTEGKLVSGRVTRIHPNSVGSVFFHLEGDQYPYGRSGTYNFFKTNETTTMDLLYRAAERGWVVHAWVPDGQSIRSNKRIDYIFVDFFWDKPLFNHSTSNLLISGEAYSGIKFPVQGRGSRGVGQGGEKAKDWQIRRERQQKQERAFKARNGKGETEQQLKARLKGKSEKDRKRFFERRNKAAQERSRKGKGGRNGKGVNGDGATNFDPSAVNLGDHFNIPVDKIIDGGFRRYAKEKLGWKDRRRGSSDGRGRRRGGRGGRDDDDDDERRGRRGGRDEDDFGRRRGGDRRGRGRKGEGEDPDADEFDFDNRSPKGAYVDHFIDRLKYSEGQTSSGVAPASSSSSSSLAGSGSVALSSSSSSSASDSSLHASGAGENVKLHSNSNSNTNTNTNTNTNHNQNFS